MALSPNGQLVATAGAGQSVILWDTAKGATRYTLPLSVSPHLWYVGWPVLAWEPSSETLAAGNSAGGGIRLWSAATGQMTAALPGPEAGLRALAWSPDGRTLAAGWNDHTVSLWSAPFRQPRAILRGHTGAIQSLAWCPDGRVLATASADGSLRLWSAATGRELVAFYAIDGGKEWLTVTTGGYFAASMHGADFLSARTEGRVRPLGDLRQRLERPDLVQRALSARSVGG
jgi:WD40 repeat protein